ncbi:uncharacterized protein cubi_02386 [Cryptosporidium ubiquitum]|uniref:Uncharacterized protein n=1 Tax=Cryptosporidium ubiquitum TaxID=857276 RepID=A0A1J4MFW3_9CRYT|nr:uncharacterized protein cubi_02386 [Cryptosporidium ubiquitum]OII73154.1 hypothetical protein cubi_02386 [Cryptosporidium ubiquitum]
MKDNTMSENDSGHISAENLPNNQEKDLSVDNINVLNALSEDFRHKDELILDTNSASITELPTQEHKNEVEDIKGVSIQSEKSELAHIDKSEIKNEDLDEVKEPSTKEESSIQEDITDSNVESPGTINVLSGESTMLNTEEDSGSINMPESSLPYKLWIDAKSRDWILEWQTKNGRWSVRKFSCKRWGKGKAYSHAMNFLASLTSCGIIKDPNFSQQLGDSGESTAESVNQANRSVEDELVLQFLSQRDAVANAEKQKNGFGSNSGLNTLAAIAAAAAAAAIASTPNKNQAPVKNHTSSQPATTTQPQVRGAVRKSGVPGVYWSQKPQGWRVVYYTGKDREFEYFKVPANASEEIISEILEVAKRFRSQVTAEGRHLPNGAVGSSSKRARMAERKAAAAAAAAAASAASAAATSVSAPDTSRHLLQSRVNHFSEEGLTDYLKNPSDIASKNLLDADPLSQFSSKFNPANITGLQNPTGAIPPGPYEWLYNPLLMNLYGNYSAASQAAAMQQWAMLQNSFSQNNGMLPSAVPGQVENSASQANPILNSFFPNPFINPFGLQIPPMLGQNANLLTQIPQVSAMNPASQMNMNMFGRYYGMTLPPGQATQSPGASPIGQNGNPTSTAPSQPDSTIWFNQLNSTQQLLPNNDQLVQQPTALDAFNPGASRADEDPSLTSEATNKQTENLLEVSSSSNKASS